MLHSPRIPDPTRFGAPKRRSSGAGRRRHDPALVRRSEGRRTRRAGEDHPRQRLRLQTVAAADASGSARRAQTTVSEASGLRPRPEPAAEHPPRSRALAASPRRAPGREDRRDPQPMARDHGQARLVRFGAARRHRQGAQRRPRLRREPSGPSVGDRHDHAGMRGAELRRR